jgi:hypothetical protein
MTGPKPLTGQERLALIRKAQAERAAKTPEPVVSVEKTQPKAKPKKAKVLSQAERKRRQQEKLEATKTKTEKLAEVVAAKNKQSPKHPSVARNLSAIKDKKPKAPNLKLKRPAKVKQQEPITHDTGYDIFAAKIEERDHQNHLLLQQADGIRQRMQKIAAREEVKLAEALRDCYGIYQKIEASSEPWMFYDILRGYFKAKLERVQTNTPDESLLVRFVFPNKKAKPVSEYATVLRFALESKIAKNDFIRWYTNTTQTKILAAARKTGGEDYSERLKRARLVLLRYFDIREEWPLGVMEYPLHLAERQVHLPDDLIFVICRGVNQFNRDVYFNPDEPGHTRVPKADVRALHFIPPNIDVAHDLINRIARFLVPRLEHYEDEINKKTADVWANDMTAYLTDEELGSAYKSSDHWADRMQASIAEDQHKFVKDRRAIQKLRDKTRK